MSLDFSDPLLIPKQVLYQAELRSVTTLGMVPGAGQATRQKITIDYRWPLADEIMNRQPTIAVRRHRRKRRLHQIETSQIIV